MRRAVGYGSANSVGADITDRAQNRDARVGCVFASGSRHYVHIRDWESPASEVINVRAQASATSGDAGLN